MTLLFLEITFDLGMQKILTTRHLKAKTPYFSIMKFWVPSWYPIIWKIALAYKKFHLYTRFLRGTQESIFACSSGLGGLSIFRPQSWHSKLSNDVLDVSVTHLEKKLFEFKILQLLNLAYFLHIKANFKRKCLNTIENHGFSNKH